jgi:hypothetical protein
VVHSVTRYFDDSPVGDIDVSASLQVLDRVAEENGENPFIRVELTVAAHDTTFQPDVWSIEYVHGPSVIFGDLEQYLKKFCPTPAQVLETVWSLKIPLKTARALFRYSR